MLTTIEIRDFAIIEQLELEFSTGMSVLSGETGAGKSIVVDAVSLLLGARGDPSMVRHGASRAEIQATFAIDGMGDLGEWLVEQELDDDESLLQLRRVVSAEGRSRGYVNGRGVSLSILREIGEQLVDIHGQNQHQSLMKRSVQLQLLDDYGDHSLLLAAVSTAYSKWLALEQESQRLAMAARERDERLDLLRFQVEELNQLAVTAGELDELTTELGRLAGGERLIRGLQHSLQLVYEGEDGDATSLLGSAISLLVELGTIDSRIGPAADLLESARIQIDEAATILRNQLDRVEIDPERQQQVEERIAAILAVARKHRVGADELPQRLVELANELEVLEGAGRRLASIDSELAAARSHYLEQAARLSGARSAAASSLAERVTGSMAALGMPGGRFAVALEPLGEGRLSADGLEQVELQVSANPGQPLQPLARVASGGELARISLAIMVILSSSARMPTLIFDEVDSGVGGGIAEMVGRTLRQLGEHHQVLCVTHLPQVAAQGHHHFQVAKERGDDTTRTGITRLDEPARIDEIARMLGGVTITDQTVAHAREMIAAAGDLPPCQRNSVVEPAPQTV